MGTRHSVVAALAGRRIDPPDAARPHFPLARVPAVRQALRELLISEKAQLLISSAACGADLSALDIASQLGVRCRVVLPFEQGRFRDESVVDRPGDWGPIFDRIMDYVSKAGDLVVVRDALENEEAFRAANQTIIAEAQKAASGPGLAIIVWEGEPRGAGDATAEFRAFARRAGFRERTVLTS